MAKQPIHTTLTAKREKDKPLIDQLLFLAKDDLEATLTGTLRNVLRKALPPLVKAAQRKRRRKAS